MTNPSTDPRLYLILRADLPPGLLLAQAAHVARKFTTSFPALAPGENENLIVLSAPDEPELLRLEQLLSWEAPLASLERFHEPDLRESLTAIAVHGGVLPETSRLLRRLLSSLPLALSQLPRAA